MHQDPVTDDSDWDTICSEIKVDKLSILRHAHAHEHAGPGNPRPRMASQLLRFMREPAELSKQTHLTLGDVIKMMTVLLETANILPKLKDSDACDFITADDATQYVDLLLKFAIASNDGIDTINTQKIDYEYACTVAFGYQEEHAKLSK
eukprot:jgi/Botrbrau1/11188/Bobra.0214s0013.1